MKKKLLALVLVVVLALTSVIGGTMAYLTDTDDAVNVMTLGNVDIKLMEQERSENGEQLVDFTQAKPLYPMPGSAQGKKDKWGMPTADNYVDKIVRVENTGKSDAYVRVLVAVHKGLEDAGMLHWNLGNRFDPEGKEQYNSNDSSSPYNTEQYTLAENYPTVIIDDVEYNVYCFTRETVLKPDEITTAIVQGFYLLDEVDYDNETGEYVLGDKRVPYDIDEPLYIPVLAQAVQTAGFEGATAALDAGFGEFNADNVKVWFTGMAVRFVEAPSAKAEVSGEDAAEYLADLQSGTDLIVDKDMDILAFDTNSVDAQGATVTMAGIGPEAYGYLAFLPDAGEDVTVSNLNVTGSGFVEVGHYGQGGGNYILNNVKIENLASTLANGDKGHTLAAGFMHFGNATLNNCVMTGTTAIQEGAIPVDLGCPQSLDTTINGGQYGTIYCWSHSNVVASSADIDTMYVAPIKGTVNIQAGTSIDTLMVSYGTSAASANRLAKLTIADGAQIGTIIFSDKNNEATTFTTVEDWNNFVENFS